MKSIVPPPVGRLLTIIVAGLASVACHSSVADDRTLSGQRYTGMAITVGAEEQEWLRANWQRLSAEEREAVRRKLRKDWRETPPEQRLKHREDLVDRVVEQVRDKIPMPGPGYGAAGWGMPGGGYGQGYETRQWEEPDSESGKNRGRR